MQKKILIMLFIMSLIMAISTLTFGDVTLKKEPVAEEISKELKLEIVDMDIKIWDMIEFNVLNPPVSEKAWVGLFKYKDILKGESYYWTDGYKSKIMVKNLGKTPYFETPKSVEAQKYVIAIFDAYGYELVPLLVSEPILVQGMFQPPNDFTEKELAHKYSLLVDKAKGNGTYDIKRSMNKGIFNPYITSEEIIKYQTFLNSDTIHEYNLKNVQNEKGLWVQIGPSANWDSSGYNYVEFADKQSDYKQYSDSSYIKETIKNPECGKVIGRVLNNSTRKGIPNIIVSCYKNDKNIAETFTKEDGSYTFELPSGIYDFESTVDEIDYYGAWESEVEKGKINYYDIFIYIQ